MLLTTHTARKCPTVVGHWAIFGLSILAPYLSAPKLPRTSERIFFVNSKTETGKTRGSNTGTKTGTKT